MVLAACLLFLPLGSPQHVSSHLFCTSTTVLGEGGSESTQTSHSDTNLFVVLLKQSLLIDENRPSNSLLLIACENLELGLITERATALNHAKELCYLFKERWRITGDRQLWVFGCCATYNKTAVEERKTCGCV